jgi:hypothetical protein
MAGGGITGTNAGSNPGRRVTRAAHPHAIHTHAFHPAQREAALCRFAIFDR